MKFSERFFKFPIRIYDSLSVRRAIKANQEQALTGEDVLITPAWVKGYGKIPYPALGQIFYSDSFKAGRELKDVREQGFDMTSIYHPDLGDFECTWNMQKFEEELDKFVDVYEAYLEELMAKEKEEETDN